MDKLGRNYVLTVEDQYGVNIEVRPPLTVEFDIQRNIMSSANASSIRVYNLSKSNRSLIRKDQYDWATPRRITLRAGYGRNMPVIFDGYINQAWSVRESVNMITTIESFDGGQAYVNGFTSQEFPSGMSQVEVFRKLTSTLPGVSLGAIGDFEGSLLRGNAYSGNTMEILSELSGNGAFIDNGKINILSDEEALDVPIIIVNAASGLLGTPVRENTYVNFEMIFEPQLVIGQLVKIESETDNDFKEIYKVISITHKGTISESVSGSATTKVGCIGLKNYKLVTQA